MLPWTSVQGRNRENSGQEPELIYGAGVGAGQVLPLSRMTAATVPLQARYGELSLRSRSKPALTTAAQRCSWVRMVSVYNDQRAVQDPQAMLPLPLPLALRDSRLQGLSLPTYAEGGEQRLPGSHQGLCKTRDKRR